MLLENKDKAAKIKLYYMTTLFIYLVLLVVSLLVDFIQGYTFIIILTLFFTIVFIILTHLKFYYIFFDIDDDKIIFRYSSLSLIISLNKTIEIPQASFMKFNIKKSFFELKKEITLYQKFKGGIAKYPPISISLLNQKDIETITKSLNAVLLHNKK